MFVILRVCEGGWKDKGGERRNHFVKKQKKLELLIVYVRGASMYIPSAEKSRAMKGSNVQ